MYYIVSIISYSRDNTIVLKEVDQLLVLKDSILKELETKFEEKNS